MASFIVLEVSIEAKIAEIGGGPGEEMAETAKIEDGPEMRNPAIFCRASTIGCVVAFLSVGFSDLLNLLPLFAGMTTEISNGLNGFKINYKTDGLFIDKENDGLKI